MGYRSQVSGKIVVSGDVESGITLSTLDARCGDEAFWVSDVIPLGDGGYSVRFETEGKAYTITEDVQRIVDVFADAGGVASGVVLLVGDESDDFSRVLVRDNVARFEQAEVMIRFSDGSRWEDQ